jgi:pilus assembly protein FimV
METALAESEEEKGFSEEEASIGLEFTPLDEIEDKLDFFFDNETAETEVENDLSAPTETTVEEVSAVPSDLFAGPDEDQEEDTAPALASFDAEPPTKDEIAAAVAGGTNESGDEIEGNLDFFFAEKSEQEPTAAGEKSEIEEMLGLEEEMPVLVSDLFDEIEVEEAGEAPASAAETDAETLEPLVQAGQESGLNRELEGELDLFFADEVEVQKPIPETVNELTEALEATIDSADENEVLLASLGTILPGIVRTPGRASIEEALRLLDTFQRQAVSAEQRSLAGLLNSTVSLLGRTAGKDKTETEKLINYLYESLARKGTDAGSVPEAVSRFTEWMRNLCATMPMIPERSGAAEEPRFEYTARELYFELAELRASIRDELAKLRHEMHHRA